MLSVIWSFDQKQIYVVAAVRFLVDVQRNVAAVIAAAENVDANIGILPFEYGSIFYGHRECETGKVESLFIGSVV